METFSFREQRIPNAHRRLKVIRREPTHTERTNTQPSPASTDLKENMDFQALSEAAKNWLRQHGLEGFLTIMEAPPNWEAEKIMNEIDIEVITEEAICALTGLLKGGIFTIDNPTIEQLKKYFSEYSTGNKAYQTQGGEDVLFREIARVLHEYGHVYSRPPSMPQNRADLIIATYEGVKVDWPVLIADGLCAAIESVRGKEGRKIGTAVAQWLTLLAPPIEPVRTIKRGRTSEGTPKTTSKRQQLLESRAPRGKATKERATSKRQAETGEEPLVRPIAIIVRQPVPLEQDPLARKINIGTQEEEAEEEPTEHLQRRQKTSTARQAGEHADPKKDGTPLPRNEEPSVQAQQQGTDSQWLRWIGEHIAGVVQYIEAEEKAQMDRLLVTTDELETARSRIRSLEQDLEMATEELAKMALSGLQIQEPVTPVTVQNKDTPVHSNKTPVTELVPDVVAAHAKELAELKEELAAQEALRTRERELKKAVEEEQRKTTEIQGYWMKQRGIGWNSTSSYMKRRREQLRHCKSCKAHTKIP